MVVEYGQDVVTYACVCCVWYRACVFEFVAGVDPEGVVRVFVCSSGFFGGEQAGGCVVEF